MKITSHGLVSVITPTYNCGKYITETIKSVLAQTYTDWEMIIVDDCSTDDTKYIVEEISKNDNRIKYYCLKKNSGAAIARNTALKLASGRWIAFLDSDDLWMETKLQEQIDFMINENYSFTYTPYDVIDNRGNPIGKIVSGPKHISRAGMLSYCWPGCLTVIYDRKKIGDICIPDIKKNNDYAMWLLICRKSCCHRYCNVLSRYRIREGSISRVGIFRLIKWHYRLFRIVEQTNIVTSMLLTFNNILFGTIKKLIYNKPYKHIQ